MTEKLPPFTGEGAVCRMCGYIGADTEFRSTGTCLHETDTTVGSYDSNPRLHRACLRCGYAWDEAPLD